MSQPLPVRLVAAVLLASATAACSPLGLSFDGGTGGTASHRSPCGFRRMLRGDVDGDGRPDVVTLSGVGRRLGACRALLTIRLGHATVHRILPMPYQADGVTGTTLDDGFTPFLLGLGPIDNRPGDEVVATLHSGASTGTASIFTLLRGAIVQEFLGSPVRWLAYNGSVQDDFSVSCHSGGVVWQSSIGWTGPDGWNVAHEQRAVYRAEGQRFVLVRRITRTTRLHSLRQRRRFRPTIPVPPDFAGCFTTRGTVPPG